MRETRSPQARLFRLGRKPDPWEPPDWSRAQPDGTFGNRFDDPIGNYRVLYSASHRISCFVETLARFRPDLTLLAELRAIEGEDDYMTLGEVPKEWCDARLMGEADVHGDYGDVYSAEWIGYLRQVLAVDCLSLGIADLDGLRAPTRRTEKTDPTRFAQNLRTGILTESTIVPATATI